MGNMGNLKLTLLWEEMGNVQGRVSTKRAKKLGRAQGTNLVRNIGKVMIKVCIN